MFQNGCFGCLNVHSSNTPNRVFLKPAFEGVTGHSQITLTSGSESFNANTYSLLILNLMSLRVIFEFIKYLTIPDSVAKRKINIIHAAIRG